MRKIIYQPWISLDGYAADAGRSTKFFEDRKYSVDSDDDLLAAMDNIDTIILGANTYKMFAEYWPMQTSTEEMIADKINTTRKLVFSSSLKTAPWGKHQPAEVINDDAIKYLRGIKIQTGKDIVLWGSISLAQSLMKNNLIDEMHIRIVPVTLGEGIPLFKDRIDELKLMDVKKYSSGLVLLQYASDINSSSN